MPLLKTAGRMPTWTGLYICPIYWSHGSGAAAVSSLTAGRMGDICSAVNHGKTAVCGSKTMGVTQQSEESDRNDSVPLISKEWDVKRSTDILSDKVGMCGISFLGFHCSAAAAAALPVWKITPITVRVRHNMAEKFINLWGQKKKKKSNIKHVFRVFYMFWLTWFQALHKTSALMPETEPETQTSQQWKKKSDTTTGFLCSRSVSRYYDEMKNQLRCKIIFQCFWFYVSNRCVPNPIRLYLTLNILNT